MTNELMTPTIKVHRCPLCKSNKIVIKLKCLNGGWNESYKDWWISCLDCGMVNIELPADNYYERKYFGTINDAVKRWNELCNRYDDTGANV